jgi:hypothetical protein
MPSSLSRRWSHALTQKGAYLTDGRRLFCVVSPLRSAERRATVVLEDCRSLEMHTFTARELYAMNLSAVSSTAGEYRRT